jgi:hypothetical protein
MAITVLTDAYVQVGGTNISDHVESVEINMEAEDVDITAMGATARNHAPGLRNDSLTINVFQDFASGEIDSIFAPLVGSASGTAVVVRPTSAATSSVNPGYSATMVLLGYQPLNGTVGEASQTSISMVCAQGSSISRVTT